ncbi:conserved Plasmodium protein, unknown function [Plasmodium ovale curtisi]|uniref:Uncharacterized protein n=1 Tax=Plasmodium ovale curtisi TaxID=864141 RepID=A0A1A8VR93_PLAOA|nr:conserved Plasmodium protein, unknown function [Plasmodium ovale curtisi]SBS83572.1 conserved Plasmodium protein, unknown function [Plasmodium ovale curtisi]
MGETSKVGTKKIEKKKKSSRVEKRHNKSNVNEKKNEDRNRSSNKNLGSEKKSRVHESKDKAHLNDAKTVGVNTDSVGGKCTNPRIDNKRSCIFKKTEKEEKLRSNWKTSTNGDNPVDKRAKAKVTIKVPERDDIKRKTTSSRSKTNKKGETCLGSCSGRNGHMKSCRNDVANDRTCSEHQQVTENTKNKTNTNCKKGVKRGATNGNSAKSRTGSINGKNGKNEKNAKHEKSGCKTKGDESDKRGNMDRNGDGIASRADRKKNKRGVRNPLEISGMEIKNNKYIVKYRNTLNGIHKYIFPIYKYGDESTARNRAILLRIHLHICLYCQKGILCNFVENYML